MLLFNPGIFTTGVPAFTATLNSIFPMARVSARMFGDRDFRREFLARSFVDDTLITDEVVDALHLASRSEGYLDGTASLMTQYAVDRELPLLPRIAVPTLIVWGALDPKPAGEEQLLADSIPGSRLVRVPDAGHYVHEESPDASADAVRSFLATAVAD